MKSPESPETTEISENLNSILRPHFREVFREPLFKLTNKLNNGSIYSLNEIYNLFFDKNFLSKQNLEKNIFPHFDRFDEFEGRPMRAQLDRFIQEAMIQRPREQALPQPEEQRRDHFYSSTGLRAIRAIRVKDDLFQHLTVGGETIVFDNNEYTMMHFTPEQRSSFQRSKMTKSLAAGINGIVEMLDAMDQGRVDLAPVFVGRTNLNMALIAQRMGFVIVDECRTADGEINKKLPRLTVVGKLADIRRKVAEFTQSAEYERLQTRVTRLQMAPAGV